MSDDPTLARLIARTEELRAQKIPEAQIDAIIQKEAEAATAPKPEEKRSLLGGIAGALPGAAKWAGRKIGALLGGAAEGTYLDLDTNAARIEREIQADERRNASGGPASPLAEMLSGRKRRQLEEVKGLRNIRDENPITATVGSVGAAFLPVSPGTMVSKLIAPASKTIGFGKRALAEGAGAVTDVAAQAVGGDKSLSEVADEGILALFLAATTGATTQKVGEMIRDLRGQSGKYIQALERAKAWLATPEAKKLSKGVVGIGEIATDEGARLGGIQADKLAAAKGRIASAEEAIEGLDELGDVAPIHSALDQSVRRFSNENPHRPDVLKAIEDTIKPNLQRPVATPVKPATDVGGDFLGYTPAGEPIVAPYATPRDVLTQRRLAREKAEFGVPQTPENAPYREIYGTLSEATHSPELPGDIGGKLKAMDKQFAEDMKLLERGNALIFNREDARAVTDNLQARTAASNRLVQALKDTQAGGAASRTLEELRALGPEYAEAVDRVAGKIAHEATRWSLKPRVFSHSGSWMLQPLIQNMEAANVQLIEPLSRQVGLQGRMAARLAPPLRDPLEALVSSRERKE